MKSKVALVKCESYSFEEVSGAVSQAIELLGGIENLTGCSTADRLLLKPNLLTKASPERACTTHPAVFEAVGSILKDSGYDNLIYGDSPGHPAIKPEKIAEECGLKAPAERLGIPFGRFGEGMKVDFPEGKTADSFVLCREVLDADAVINICKMKTHQLERVTGAMKNIFGCVYGVNKGASHAKYPTPEIFARMIGDLVRLVKPVLHIMDGITAMEGNGPGSGTPKDMNVILVSTDPVALDSVFCHLVYLDPALVPTNVAGQEQGIGTYTDVDVVTVDGSITLSEAAAIYGDSSFDVQRSGEYRGALNAVRFLAPFLEKKPVIIKEKCSGCGICVKACPVEGKAISIVNGEGNGRGIARYDYEKCIKCYCCQEMCPNKAINVKKSFLARLADRNWKI